MQVFADAARAQLVSITSNSMVVSSGARFPLANRGTAADLPSNTWFKLVLAYGEQYEVCYVRTHTGNGTFNNVLRGQDGTSVTAWPVDQQQTTAFIAPIASDMTEMLNALDTKAPASHTHDATSITSGVLADARLPARLRATPQNVTDWNTAVGSGWYQGNGAANAPTAGLFIGNVECHHDRWVTQVVHAVTTDSASDTKTYRRESSDASGVAAWGPWYRLRLSEAEQAALRQAWWDSTAVPINKVTNLQTALDSKVDKVAGKRLSTEDYTSAEKTKLSGIASGATANSTDANLRDRSTHTGTQHASTIIDFGGSVRAVLPNPAQSNVDMKTLKYTGFYPVLYPLDPPTGAIGFLEVLAYSPDWMVQRYYALEHIALSWRRNFYGGDTWGPWVLDTNQITAVNSMADGGIIESGSNANGTYTKFADGTQICIKIVQREVSITNASGAIYYSVGLDLGSYAAPFVGELPKASVSAFAGNGLSYPTLANLGTLVNPPIIYLNNSSPATGVATVFITATGRWK